MYSSKPLITVVILSFVIVLVSGSFAPFIVYAEPPASGYYMSTCDTSNMPESNDGGVRVTCCWREHIPGQILGKEYCQTCTQKDGKVYDCTAKQPQALGQQPTSSQPLPPTVGENILQHDSGVLEQMPGQGIPSMNQGQVTLPKDGIIQQQPDTQQPLTSMPHSEQTQSGTIDEEPVCPNNQVFDKKSGLCLDEEPEQTHQSKEGQNEDGSTADNNNSDNNEN
ncbi:MAG: hypothetical protein R2685_16230 [Candidatus Nitrosocosmicus sp.]|nr:hypothetical protein [Candidatus Nitrosocosmicus sp.]